VRRQSEPWMWAGVMQQKLGRADEAEQAAQVGAVKDESPIARCPPGLYRWG
jgi:hypothetical protein